MLASYGCTMDEITYTEPSSAAPSGSINTTSNSQRSRTILVSADKTTSTSFLISLLSSHPIAAQYRRVRVLNASCTRTGPYLQIALTFDLLEDVRNICLKIRVFRDEYGLPVLLYSSEISCGIHTAMV